MNGEMTSSISLEGTQHFISQRLGGVRNSYRATGYDQVIERLANPKSPNWQFFFPPILTLMKSKDDEETGSLSISTNLPEDYES